MGTTLTDEEVLNSMRLLISEMGRLYYYFLDADYDDWCRYSDIYAKLKNLSLDMEKKLCSFLR